ncbi:ATP-dependent Caseinolytic protease [Bacillus phage vB_Bacillus_1020A]|jgi:HK97 family phage major capsid protein|uniref:phage major capsid protein n=1 Tax=Robertmurraya sp. DFI.2.37 TaxID=3031819 RepID=UPI001245EC15|nr:phage major capsid protein [Robertmurraya sp. DFI.2.37]MDF1510819.1 phage major capsid protein [Robertmurraya sp. DFI.2.37]QIW89299.1 ATP-dependent Caseinolytic protease [Bacillus phage vB_Bacillus_1020A]
MKTLFELKQDMATIGQQLQKIESELAQKAVDPKASMEDIKALQDSKKDLQMRFDVIKEQHDTLEKEQKEKFAAQQQTKNLGLGSEADPKQKVIKAKAELIRSTMRQKAVSSEVFQALGDDTTGGGKFLPKTVSNDIIMEPLAKNPLRGHSALTNITNLEIPKLSYTLDDDDFIADKETAKELELTGDTVSFGRYKFKVFAGVSETVLNGTDTNLVQHVENALKSGVAAKEKKVAFATTPKAGEEHMSFYQTGANAIKRVQGVNLYKAIKAAIADLHEDYRENAKIFMTFADYSEIIEDLANGNATLYTAQPEQVLGKPVIFADGAVNPVVGDFSYSHFNYDIGELFERDKDVKTGIEQFVVTAWFDHQIKLKSAFRIAEVTSTP